MKTLLMRIIHTWKKVGLWVGKRVATAVLLVVYGVLFAPFGIVMGYRYRKDRAQKKESYFVDHDASSDTRYEHQF